MLTVAFIDRCLASMIRRGADALVFAAGDRPRLYLEGKSLPIARCPDPLRPDDVARLAKAFVPSGHLEAPRPHLQFKYGQLATVEMIFERTPGSCRLTFWKRGV